MANATYESGTVSVTAAATHICTVSNGTTGVLIANTGSVSVFLGGPDVGASGFPVGAGDSVIVPAPVGRFECEAGCDLYAITSSETSTVAYLL